MNQQRLAQTLAQNSQAMSNMIMDSWNQKQASDARISQARSEAIRGVNSYQTTYGQNVDVSVTADHVYQDRYGDVYGVSGTAPDQEFLNRVHLYSENGWESISGEELSDKLDEVDEEYIIDAGSGERLELKDPEW